MALTEAPGTTTEPGGRRPRRRYTDVLVVLLGLGGLALFLAGLAAKFTTSYGLVVLAFGIGLVAAYAGLVNPAVSVVYVLVTTFFRQTIPLGPLPVDPFLIAFVGLVLSVFLWVNRHPAGTRNWGWLEAVVGLYLFWNVLSLIAPHEYSAIEPVTGDPVGVGRFLTIGIAMPLVMMLLARRALVDDRSIRTLLMCTLGAATYSSYVSIGQFVAPSLVFPRYVVQDPQWEGRAVGIFNQPVVNGLVLIAGYLAAVLLASRRDESRLVRFVCVGIALLCCVSVYLTHTRATWASLAMVVVLGIWLARGWRTGFVITFVVMVVGVAANWSEFTSSDRAAGGVGSKNEIWDRFNIGATSVWAFEQKPWFGWGLGRFVSVNTYHHQGFSSSVPWQRGFGIASHFDALGVAAELGIVGITLWVGIWVVTGLLLWRAIRRLPLRLYDHQYAVMAALIALTLFVTGLTVDLRFFDFPNFLIWMVIGAAIGRTDVLLARGRSG